MAEADEPEASSEFPGTNGAAAVSEAPAPTIAAPPRTRRRSPSKTQYNYNPIHTTSISLLNAPPEQQQPHRHHKTRRKRDLPTARSAPIDGQPHTDARPLTTSVHVVKLASVDKPGEYLKILAVPEFPDSLKIGRQNMPKATNKITDGFFDSRVLSRNHAELFVKHNRLYIKDLKSSNGTFINDAKLEPFKDYELSVDDKLDLGTTLESQVAHKKITVRVAEFDYVSLGDFETFVKDVLQKDDLAAKRLQLFNSTVDALIFGELVDERQEDGLLMALVDSDSNANEDTEEREVAETSRFVSGLNVRPSSSMQDIIRKLAVAVNNEFIQQQRLKQMSKALKCYSGAVESESRSNSPDSMDSAKLALFQTEIERLKRRVGDMKKEHEAELKRVSEEYQRLYVRLKEKQSESDRSREETADWKRRAESRGREIAKLQAQHKALQLKLDETTSAKQSVEDQLEQANKRRTLVDKSVSVEEPPKKDEHNLAMLYVLVSLGVLLVAVLAAAGLYSMNSDVYRR